MEVIISLIEEFGFETVVLALVINVLTTIIKIPIKLLAQKLNNPSSLTRFIVFMPLVIGFVSVLLMQKYIIGQLVFDSVFITQWITSSSLSLAMYAVVEKMFATSTATASEIVDSSIDNGINEGEELETEIEEVATQVVQQLQETQKVNKVKIILGNKKI